MYKNISQPIASKKQLLTALSFLTLVMLLIYLAVSCAVRPFQPSINFDDGWMEAINYLPFSQYIAGRDYVFTYGPLYFLDVCLGIEPNQSLASLFYAFEHTIIAWILFFYRRAFSPARFFLFVAALLISQFISHNDYSNPSGNEYIPIVILVLLLSVNFISNAKERFLSSIAAGIYAAILMFLKFDLAIEVFITVTSYFLLTRLFKIPYPRLSSLLFFGVWLGSLSILIALVFKEPANCFNWLLTNIEHISLYTGAHDLPSPSPFFPAVAVATILIYLFVILRNAVSRDRLAYIGLALLPSVVLLFKHGFILAETCHINSFYKYMLVVIACLLFFAKRRSDVFFLLIPFSCLSVLVPALDYMHAYWARDIDNPSRLASLKLTDSFLPGDRKEKTFDSVPYSMVWCFANNLNYKPNPFVVLYHGATSGRDKEAAQYFSGSKAPDYLFCEHFAPYRRNMFVETPCTWANILNSYQIKNYQDQKYLLLLEKKTKSALPTIAKEQQFNCSANKWYAVPACNNPVFCSFDLHLNLLGKICRWFYKISSISINLKYADGHMQNFKLVPGVLKNGILINYLPEDMPALRLLFENKTRQAVTQIELTGPGLQYYEMPIKATWMKETNKVIETRMSEVIPPQLKPAVLPVGKFSVANASLYSPSRDYTDFSAASAVPVFKKNEDELISLILMVFEEDRSIFPTSLFIQVDNGPLISTASGVKLVERGIPLPTREAMIAGFMTVIDVHNMKAGLHTIQAVAKSRKDGKWYRIPKAAHFSLE